MSATSLPSNSDATSNSAFEVAPGIRESLWRFRRNLRVQKFRESVYLCILIVALAFVIAFAIDRAIDANSFFRVALLVMSFGLLAVSVISNVLRPFLETRRLTQIARQLRGKFPRLSDQLLSVIELASDSGEQSRSPALVSAAMSQVERRVLSSDLKEALPRSHQRNLFVAAGVAMTLVVSTFLFTPAAATNTLLRWLMPWKQMDRFTFARLETVPKSIVVPFGESFYFDVALQNDSDWKPQLATCITDSARYQASLDLTDHRYHFELAGQLEQSNLSIHVGDASLTSLIVPMNRPELSELEAIIDLPEYLKYAAPQITDARSGTIYALPGSELTLVGRANRKLSSATINSLSLELQDDNFRTQSIAIGEPTEHRIEWQDEHGLTQSEARVLKIRVAQDKLPTVNCQGISQQDVWLASDTLKFDVSAEDDYGISRLGIQWRILGGSYNASNNPRNGLANATTQLQANRESSPGHSSGETPYVSVNERTVVTGTPESKRLTGQATFNCLTEKLEPQLIELRVFAEDYRGLEGRSYSVPYVIKFMSAAEHADWIAAQLRRWKGKLDGNHDEEMKLLDQNRELRESIAQLEKLTSDGETRGKLNQQSKDERNNSESLGKTLDEGRRLLEQALRNEEIRSQQIESWAQALDRLNDIAQNSMPQVAAQVDQAAESLSNEKSAKAPSRMPANDSENPDLNLSKLEKSQERKDTSERDQDNKAAGGSSQAGSLPSALLGPASGKQKEDPSGKDGTSSSNSVAKEHLDQAIADQTRLLDEFRKSRDAFGDLLSELENSTFIKRLKAAAEVQRQLAKQVNSIIGSTFGKPASSLSNVENSSPISLSEPLENAANNLERILRDLEAYQREYPAQAREEVLSDMKSLDSLTKLKELPLRLARNLRGDTLHRIDFWADTFDRWAEELAGPGRAGGPKGGEEKSRDRLPQSLLLEILRIIYDQIDLRNETRTLAQLKSTDETEKQNLLERTTAQAVGQMHTQQRTLNVIGDIRAIPDSLDKFNEELRKLNKAVQHMDDASAMLVEGFVNDEILAAQTAAIEALIDARRSGGSGNGNGDNGSGSLAGGSTSRMPLDMVGPANDRDAKLQSRQGGDATGNAGRVMPDEYREGLDRFLNKLNQKRGQP